MHAFIHLALLFWNALHVALIHPTVHHNKTLHSPTNISHASFLWVCDLVEPVVCFRCVTWCLASGDSFLLFYLNDFYGLSRTPVEDRYGNRVWCVVFLAAVGLFASQWQIGAAHTTDDQFNEFTSDCPRSSNPTCGESFWFFCLAFFRNYISELRHVPIVKSWFGCSPFWVVPFWYAFLLYFRDVICIAVSYCTVSPGFKRIAVPFVPSNPSIKFKHNYVDPN